MEKGNELFNEAIKVLNEKGYHVVEASNGSDVKDSYYKDEVMSKERYDFEMNEGNPEIQVIKEDNDGDLIVRRYNRGNPVKVLFDKRYDVELPQGFHFAGTSEGTGFKYDIITTKIDDNGNVVRKSNEEIEKDIENIDADLLITVKGYKDLTNNNIDSKVK